jgi:hypothetical protein
MDIAEMVRRLVAMRFDPPNATNAYSGPWGIDQSGNKATGAADVRKRLPPLKSPKIGRD